MAIVASDLLFLASERMTDDVYNVPSALAGGGLMSSSFVQDGVENNAFPDVMPADRVAGLTQVRRIYAAALSDDNDALANTVVGVFAPPTDPNVDLCVFSAVPPDFRGDNVLVGGQFNYLSAPAALEAARPAAFARKPSAAFATGTINSGTNILNISSGGPLVVGDKIEALTVTSGDSVISWRTVTAVTGGGTAGGTATFDGAAVSFTYSVNVYQYERAEPSAVGFSQASGAALLAASVSAAATVVEVDRLMVRIDPPGVHDVQYFNLRDTDGQQPLFFAGDRVLIQHPTVPATREWAEVEFVNYFDSELTFTAGLTNAYPSGTSVSRPVSLGALRAQTYGTPYVLQTWLRIWGNDAVAPTAPLAVAAYRGAFGLVNDGAITDRWACVFTSSTQFNLISERFGQIAAGNIATDFSPLNPLTSQPYFTLYASGWGAGWLPGNALRFNTQAAAAPFWVLRCTKPGGGSGTDQAKLFILGDVDA